ncbi:MAG: DUF456 domain-containing protein [Planctomycetota bacterium]
MRNDIEGFYLIYVLAILLLLLNLCWLFLVVLGLPGNWLMVLSVIVVAWWQWDSNQPMFGMSTLVTIVVLATLSELFEFFSSIVGSKKAGGTRRGSIGAILGGILGGLAATFLIPVPLLGSLIGACVGAALGAWVLELYGGLEMSGSLQSGLGAGVGRLVGTVVKLFAGAAIWIVVAFAAFWP